MLLSTTSKIACRKEQITSLASAVSIRSLVKSSMHHEVLWNRSWRSLSPSCRTFSTFAVSTMDDPCDPCDPCDPFHRLFVPLPTCHPSHSYSTCMCCQWHVTTWATIDCYHCIIIIIIIIIILLLNYKTCFSIGPSMCNNCAILTITILQL